MTYYRLYFMDPRSGHICRFEEFETAAEDEAIERAEQACRASPVELWSGRRKVHRVEPRPLLPPEPTANRSRASLWRRLGV